MLRESDIMTYAAKERYDAESGKTGCKYKQNHPSNLNSGYHLRRDRF